MREYQTRLDEGYAKLEYPDGLSKVSAQDMLDWLALIEAQLQRVIDEPEPTPPPGASE